MLTGALHPRCCARFPPNPIVWPSGQLCWSNASLVSFISQNVRSFLREQPDASIISVSQNDNRDYCQSSAEMAIIQAEGSPMGPLLRAVNAVADSIADEFPHVAVRHFPAQFPPF